MHDQCSRNLTCSYRTSLFIFLVGGGGRRAGGEFLNQSCSCNVSIAKSVSRISNEISNFSDPAKTSRIETCMQNKHYVFRLVTYKKGRF